jgi:hypothetical protein
LQLDEHRFVTLDNCRTRLNHNLPVYVSSLVGA